jgi:hypothetical protein
MGLASGQTQMCNYKQYEIDCMKYNLSVFDASILIPSNTVVGILFEKCNLQILEFKEIVQKIPQIKYVNFFPECNSESCLYMHSEFSHIQVVGRCRKIQSSDQTVNVRQLIDEIIIYISVILSLTTLILLKYLIYRLSKCYKENTPITSMQSVKTTSEDEFEMTQFLPKII